MNHARRILVRAVLITTVSAVTTAATLAHDIMKVSPETHKVMLDNEHVRVLDVHIEPGERVAVHWHLP